QSGAPRRVPVLGRAEARLHVALERRDVGEVAVLALEVEPVADHEAVLDREALVVDGDLALAARGLVEERADLERLRVADAERIEEEVHREAGVDYVLDYEDVLSRDGLGEVEVEPDAAR